MYYAEEEILKRREEEKKKKYNTVEQGYYIHNEILYFEKERLLDKFTVYLPSTFRLMPLELARIKYPSEFRPQLIITSLDLSINFGFSIFSHELREFQAEKLAEQIMQRIERENQGILLEFNKIEEVAGYYFTFRSHAMDIDLYNMQLFLPFEETMLQATFNCPYQQHKEWREVALLMWKTIHEIKSGIF